MKDSQADWEPVATDFTKRPLEHFWFIGNDTTFNNDQVEIGGQLSPPFDTKGIHVLTVEETAKILGISKNAAYESIKDGEIPVISFGKSLRVPTQLLQRLFTKPNGKNLRIRKRT